MEFVATFSDFKVQFTILHVISVVCGMGSALISDALFNFYGKDKILSGKEQRVLMTLSNIVWFSLAAIIITGLCIFLTDPATYAVSTKFLVKMTIVGILTLNGYALFRFVSPHLVRKGFLIARNERVVRRVAFACGAVSVTSWFSALTLGMMKGIPFSYSEAMLLYALVVILAASIAVFIEYRTFEVRGK